MRDSRIVYLNTRSFPSYISILQHVYAELQCDEHDSVSLEKTLTDIEARTRNRYEPDYHWEDGDTTSRLKDNDEARKIALEQWKQHFPDAEVLIHGRKSIAEPQEVIIGLTPEARAKLNTIFMKCEELEWWDGGHEDEVQDLSDKWFALLKGYLEEK